MKTLPDREFVIFDCSYIAWRMANSVRNLKFDEPVIHGFLTEFMEASSILGTVDRTTFIFAFDFHNVDYKRTLVPDYKTNRKKRVDRARMVKASLEKLRNDVLPSLGFPKNNWFHEMYYEADDVIGEFVKTFLTPADHCYVFSGDSDMYQLISQNCEVFDSFRGPTTLDIFRNRFGIEPKDWPVVRALAGDVSDGYKGIPRINQTAAISHIQGKLYSHHRKYIDECMENDDSFLAYENRLKVSTIPCVPEGVKLHFDPKYVRLTLNDWNKTCERYGFKKLMKTESSVLEG